MSMPCSHHFEFTEDPANTAVVQSHTVDVSDWSDKGYDFTRGVGSTFVGALSGSVAGDEFDEIITLAATSQGAIPAHYNYVRISVTTAGDIGHPTHLKLRGKAL